MTAMLTTDLGATIYVTIGVTPALWYVSVFKVFRGCRSGKYRYRQEEHNSKSTHIVRFGWR
jgi:hypothetical protein